MSRLIQIEGHWYHRFQNYREGEPRETCRNCRFTFQEHHNSRCPATEDEIEEDSHD